MAGALLIEGIERLIGHPCAHIRRLSAHILAKMNRHEDKDWLRPQCGDSMNMYHGKLVYWSYKDASADMIESIQWRSCPLIQDELISLSLKSGKGIPERASQKNVLRWIANLSEDDVANSREVAQAVIGSITEVNHPFYRDLLVAAAKSYTDLIDQAWHSHVLAQWFSSKFNMGIVVLLEIAGSRGWPIDDARIKQWLEGLDVVVETISEDLKQELGKSSIVRKLSPMMHALLLLDESATVRMAASVDGLNCLVSFERVVGGIRSEDLESFLAESSKYAGRTDVVIEYSIRSSARKIVGLELNRRRTETF